MHDLVYMHKSVFVSSSFITLYVFVFSNVEILPEVFNYNHADLHVCACFVQVQTTSLTVGSQC